MIKRKLFAILSTTLCILHISYSQNVGDYPEVGKRVPEFVLKDIYRYDKKQLSSTKLGSRHIILDFWNKYCTACISSFPKVNDLSAKFKDKLDIILVGRKETGVQQIYENYRNKRGLDLPIAYDSVLYNRFVPRGAPYLVWIDSTGIVKAISGSTDLTPANIEAFLMGKTFQFNNISYGAIINVHDNYNRKIPLLINGNGGGDTDFLFRSVLVKYAPNDRKVKLGWPSSIFKIGGDKRRLEGTGDLKTLYRIALLGKATWDYQDSLYANTYMSPILEVSDSSQFISDISMGDNCYTYSLMVPFEKSTPQFVMATMQRDLKNYFNYDVNIEIRKMPYWKLVATPKAKYLKTKGGRPSGKADYNSYEAKNLPFSNFLASCFYIICQKISLPIIDETGIDYNLDINVKVDNTSFDDIRRVFKEIGLEFVKAEKEFKVIVIKDPRM